MDSTTGTADPTDSPTSTQTDTSSTPADTATNTSTETPTATPEEQTPTTSPEPEPTLSTFQLKILQRPEPLPGAWTEGRSIEEFKTGIRVVAQSDNGTVGTVKILKDSRQIVEWTADTNSLDRNYSIPITELDAGANQIRVTADNYQGASQEMTVEKLLPDNFLLDLQPANTENSNSPVFTTYSSNSQFTHDKKEIDLNQLEEWHDNDYDNLSEMHPKMKTFVEGVTDENKLTEEKHLTEERANGFAVAPYPNRQESEYYGGHFEEQTYKQAESAGDALDWLHPLLLNFEEKNTDDGAISTEDEHYAAVFQECFDQYNDNFDAHAWSFDLEYSEGGTHGNGFIYDTTKDELRILETVESPATSTVEDGRQYHPLIEDSNYLEPGHDAYEDYWHPLRFDGTEPEADYVDFREGKASASQIFRGIATGVDDEDIEKASFTETGIGITTDYLVDIIDTLSNYNEQDQFEFEEIKNQSKVYNKLRSMDGNYIAGGTVENPIYAEVEDDSVIEDVWEDEEGTLTDYVDDFEDEAYQQITVSETTGSPNQVSRAVETGWNL